MTDRLCGAFTEDSGCSPAQDLELVGALDVLLHHVVDLVAQDQLDGLVVFPPHQGQHGEGVAQEGGADRLADAGDGCVPFGRLRAGFFTTSRTARSLMGKTRSSPSAWSNQASNAAFASAGRGT